MLDTRPVGDEREWVAPPFSAETVEVEGEQRIIGRGTFNTKHGVAGSVDVIKTLSEQHRLPINIELIIDPEEEVMSVAITEVLSEKKDYYQKVDAAFYPVCAETYKSIWLSFKGISQVKINFISDISEVHSGFGSVMRQSKIREGLDNFLELVEAENANQIQISEFLGTVSEKERELARLFAQKTTLEEFAEMRGLTVEELKTDNVEELILDEMKSVINLLGWGSEVKQGTLPTTCFAEMEFRLAPSVTLSAQEIEEKIKEYLQSKADTLPHGMRIGSIEFIGGTDEGFKAAEFDDPLVQTIEQSYGNFDSQFSIVPSVFGSVPAGAKIVKTLNVPFLMGGLGVGGKQHVANEYLTENSYKRFKQFLTVFFHLFAKIKQGEKNEKTIN